MSMLQFILGAPKDSLPLLRRANSLLSIIGCLILAGFFFLVKTTADKLNSAGLIEEVQKEEGSLAADQQSPQAKPFSYYEGIIGKRALFRVTAFREQKDKNGAAKTIVSSELLNNYSLKGVMGGDNPQAVIEDKKSKQTYFLSQGQLLGEFKVDEVQEGKVIFDINGQKMELSL